MSRLFPLLFLALASNIAFAGEDPDESGADRKAREEAEIEAANSILEGLPGITTEAPASQEEAVSAEPEPVVPPAATRSSSREEEVKQAPSAKRAEPADATAAAAPETNQEKGQAEEGQMEFAPLGSPEAAALTRSEYNMATRDDLNAEIDRLNKLIQKAELEKKLRELQGAPTAEQRAAAERQARQQSAPRMPAPTVEARSTLGGKAQAVLRFSNGGELTVAPGDALPEGGKVLSIDKSGVTVMWHGERTRLFDASSDEQRQSTSNSMMLPAAPLDVMQ